MPIAKNSFVRTTAVLIIIGALALLAIVGTNIWLVGQAQNYFNNVIQARDVRSAATDLRKSLQDMEAGQRGYLLTDDARYLEPYQASRSKIAAQYEALEKALIPYPQYHERFRDLVSALDQKIAEIETTISLYQDGRQAEAIGIVRTDRGKRLMDEANLIFDGIIEASDRRMVAGVEDQSAINSAMRWITILGGLVIVGVVGGAVWMALAYTRELINARLELESLNTDLEERVKERTQDLIQANEEVQRFAYIVTHDLRAPLVNIMGFTAELDETMKSIQAYVLADGEPLSEQEIEDARTAAAEDLPEAIGFIRSSTRKMDGLINAILKISREGRRPLKPEQIDLKALLEATAATVHHQVSETGGEVGIEVDVPEIVSDRLSLDQIFGNLLDNAVKYRAVDRPIEIRISARRELAGRVRIDVSDNGRGIPSQDYERVFDLFRRSGSQDQPGEGIGLAHVRTLVRGLGGDITLSSEVGQGTTFTIMLPTDVRVFMRRNGK
ncbi:CHASE3 domain-containing protein [Mesorhizobium sp. J18]|uniref:sensor histidine kinase n=1 Tax=Mesorhizobium sp. J18 TaxID=935263 RepID=UPI0011A21F73|nr:CHASE3 domain-containing protein [Mesorhizobium sp. J18]